jgi:apolipoprotein N-acyltransferase
VVTVPESFAAGPGPSNIALPGLPSAAVLICYEAIFPHDLIDPLQRPDWIINVTNDAWFGKSSGPYQHLAQARLRTIEQGLPLVRAANTGISAIIDPYGRIETSLDLGLEGVLDGQLPKALAPTLYSRTGDWSLLALMLVLGMIGFAAKYANPSR